MVRAPVEQQRFGVVVHLNSSTWHTFDSGTPMKCECIDGAVELSIGKRPIHSGFTFSRAAGRRLIEVIEKALGEADEQ